MKTHLVALLVVLMVSSLAVAQEVVTAVVVKSYDDTYHLRWYNLNDYWYDYGDTQVFIDYTTLIDRYGTFTLADLEGVGADVVIVSGPAGIRCQWQQSEVDALEAFRETPGGCCRRGSLFSR